MDHRCICRYHELNLLEWQTKSSCKPIAAQPFRHNQDVRDQSCLLCLAATYLQAIVLAIVIASHSNQEQESMRIAHIVISQHDLGSCAYLRVQAIQDKFAQKEVGGGHLDARPSN